MTASTRSMVAPVDTLLSTITHRETNSLGLNAIWSISQRCVDDQCFGRVRCAGRCLLRSALARLRNTRGHAPVGGARVTMKTCPFCKEDVRPDAIKCRYCQSMLVPVGPSVETQDQRRVTYVLDRDLVRFAKFSAAVLAVFLVVGAYLFGFRLEAALEKVRSTQKDLESAQSELRDAQKELDAAQAMTRKLKVDVESVLAEARRYVGEISSQRILAIDIVATIRELNPQQSAAAKQGQPLKTRAESQGKFWRSGAILRVRFLGGDAATHEKVKAIASEWTKHANISFDFVTSGDADIRVTFDKNYGAWSMLGTDALGLSQDDATMNLGRLDKRTVLHEFGHVLGLIEEHQNPRSNIRWNRARVLRETSAAPYFWDKEYVEANLFRKIPADQLPSYREFDAKSIMMMSFPLSWTGGLVVQGGEELSQSDKALVARLYPQ